MSQDLPRRWPRRGILIRLAIYVPLISLLAWRARGGCNSDPPVAEEDPLEQKLAPHRKVITLPDGSQKRFEQSVTVDEVAASIGAGLRKAALAGRVDGKLVDTSYTIERDARLEIVTDKHPAALEVLRHSTAHLLAQAVQSLFPDAQVTIGPVIENGFYYDFSYKRPFTPEDLAAIEAKMTELAKKDEKVERRVLPRDEAVAYFKGLGEHYKAEIIGSIPAGEDVSLYREGGFEDLCRGPHVPSTGKLKHFKLMKVAGAYWRGDHRNEMLQRIYGTAWATKDELQQYLHMLEEAEKRDHRKLGRELDLFHMDEAAPGLVFWHPKGWTIWQQVEQYMRRVYRDNGYLEVRCPQILDRSLWERYSEASLLHRVVSRVVRARRWGGTRSLIWICRSMTGSRHASRRSRSARWIS